MLINTQWAAAAALLVQIVRSFGDLRRQIGPRRGGCVTSEIDLEGLILLDAKEWSASRRRTLIRRTDLALL